MRPDCSALLVPSVREKELSVCSLQQLNNAGPNTSSRHIVPQRHCILEVLGASEQKQVWSDLATVQSDIKNHGSTATPGLSKGSVGGNRSSTGQEVLANVAQIVRRPSRAYHSDTE